MVKYSSHNKGVSQKRKLYTIVALSTTYCRVCCFLEYSLICSILIIFNPHVCANALQSSRRAMEPSSSSGLTSSHSSPAGGRPVSLHMSIPSVSIG